jgi:tryptophanyl-tRNA synthetase
MGYGDAKKKLLAKFETVFGGEMRERRREMDQKPDLVEDILVEGAKRARTEAVRTMEAVYQAVGIPHSKLKGLFSFLS